MEDERKAKVESLLDALLAQRQAVADVERKMETLHEKYIDPDRLWAYEADKEELAENLGELQADLKSLSDVVREEVLALGKTVKHAGLRAQWTKGSIKWDTKSLEAATKKYPWLAGYRKEGKPSVKLYGL